MQTDFYRKGREELRAQRNRHRWLFYVVGVFSLFANLLTLTGPLYMLQVYDRVLLSGSRETLVVLSVLVAFLFGILWLLELSRTRLMSHIALRFQIGLERRVFDAALRKAAVLPDQMTHAAQQDLEAIRRAISAPGMLALFDLPWIPVFFAVIFAFHPLLGVAALAGVIFLVLMTFANQYATRADLAKAADKTGRALIATNQFHAEAEFIRAMALQNNAYSHWRAQHQSSLAAEMRSARTNGAFITFSKVLRLFLQSAMLGLAAWLVIGGQMTAGGMIAGSVILGRVLAPVDALLNGWPVAQQGLRSWRHLAVLLGQVPSDPETTSLPKPRAHMSINNLTVAPPGERVPILKALSFSVEPGQAVGVIGPSGMGKSCLARALTGVWPALGGHIRLDTATLDQYQPEVLGRYIGYLPQRVPLFDGTIAQNIARLAIVPDDARVVAAAKLAGAHKMILRLPKGYDTQISTSQLRLSGGQVQRIGLARALYGDPVVVILDEPNSNLDNDGSNALNHAIRQLKAQGKSVLIMAHRPAAIHECEMLLVLDGGKRMAFGPRDQVLAGMVKNAKSIKSSQVAQAGLS